MRTLWHVDALDARAGHAFVSYRDPDLGNKTIDLGLPAVFIEPPSFRADVVTSRATGFAATRGSFQFGLFIGKEEAGFRSLQGVTEFVRRVYLSSGGGDGDGGSSITPPMPPSEPQQGGEPLALGDDFLESRSVRSLIHVAETLDKHISSTEAPGEVDTRADVFTESLSENVDPGSNRGLLTYAGALLVYEMLRRFPTNLAELAKWLNATARLGQVLSGLGLLGSLLTDSIGDQVRKLAEGIYANSHVPFVDPYPYPFAPHPLLAVLGVSVFGPSMWMDWHEWQELVRRRVIPIPLNTPSQITGDPFDDLSSWALPAHVAESLDLDKRNASARDLLCMVAADPRLIIQTAKGKKQSERLMAEIISILLLSSVHVVSIGRVSLSGTGSAFIGESMIGTITRDALFWLEAQMPSRAFAEPVEKMIRGASGIRYRAGRESHLQGNTSAS